LSAMFYLEHPTFLTQYFGPYEVQLLLNFLWSVVFFKLQKPLIALIINFIMIGLTAYLLWLSWKNSMISFWLLVPYALWITFAFYLNFYIVIKSKTR
jgi:tryptophan-rich sensory protein